MQLYRKTGRGGGGSRIAGRRGHVVSLIVIGWLIVGAHAVAGRHWYVATNGVPGDADRWSNALTNIQHALDVAQDGDTILLAGHRFNLTNGLTWNAGASGVALRGGYAATNDAALPGAWDPRQWPSILRRNESAPQFSVLTMTHVTNGTLSHVTVSGGFKTSASAGNGGGGLDLVECRDVLLDACVITDNFATKSGTYGSALGGGIRASNSVVVITNGVIARNEVRACSGGYALGGGLAVLGGTVTVADTVLSGNRVWGPANAYGVDGGGLYNAGGTVTLRNCLLTGNRATERGSGAANAAGVLNLSNCTVANNARDGIFGGGGSVSVSDSILWGNGHDVTGSVTVAWCAIEDGTRDGVDGCFADDPLFQRGYYLAPDSPCVNAGSDSADALGMAAYTTRTDGTPDAGQVDLGWHYPAGLASLDLHVSPAGNDSDNGLSWEHALRSVGAAIARASAGTRIHLASGVYGSAVETFPLLIDGITGLELIGTNAADTVLDAGGSNQRVLTIRADGVRIAGITVRGGRFSTPAPSELGGGGILAHAAGGVVIADSILSGNVSTMSGTYGITHGGGLLVWDSDVLMTNTMVVGNRSVGNSGGYSYGAGISLMHGTLTLRDSVIRRNEASSWANSPGVYGGGLFNWGGRLRVRNAILSANTAYNGNPGKDGGSAFSDQAGIIVVSGLVYGINQGSVRSILENVTVANNSSHGVRAAGSGSLAVTNSILWGNGGADVDGPVILSYCTISDGTDDGINGNMSLDPLFTSGFYLADDSPCIDAGTNTAASWGLDTYTTQVDGTPDAGPVDLGWHYRDGLGTLALYVSPDGNDANSGTEPEQPLRTISAALSKSLDGTRIHVASGSYPHPLETFPLTISGLAGVRITGTNAAMTLIDAAGANQRVFSITGDGTRLERLTIAGGYRSASSDADGGGIQILGANDVRIVSCIVSNNTGNETLTGAITRGGGIHSLNSSLRVTDSRIVNNRAISGSGGKAQGSGISIENGSAVISRCVFQTNAASGWFNATFIGAALHNAGGSVRVESSLLHRNTSTRDTGGVYNESGVMILYNCTVVSNSSPGVLHGAAGVLALTNCIVWAHGVDLQDFPQDNGTLLTVGHSLFGVPDTMHGIHGCWVGDPRFVNAQAGDYRLQRGLSPGIDAGVNQGWMSGATDLDGLPRVMYSDFSKTVDMGAYELIPLPGSLLRFR